MGFLQTEIIGISSGLNIIYNCIERSWVVPILLEILLDILFHGR